jgi:hypothetical protein
MLPLGRIRPIDDARWGTRHNFTSSHAVAFAIIPSTLTVCRHLGQTTSAPFAPVGLCSPSLPAKENCLLVCMWRIGKSSKLGSAVHHRDAYGCQAAFGHSWNSPRRTENASRIHLGKFRGGKPAPKDIDILLIMEDDFQVDELAVPSRAVFDSVRAKLLFESDIFWARSSIGHEMLELWLDTYQISRSFRKRGIVELELS